MKILSNSINSVWYTYDANFRYLEELSDAGTGEALTESVKFLLFVLPQIVRRRSELEDTSYKCSGRMMWMTSPTRLKK